MSTDTVYRLISGILSIAGSYDAATFDRAIEHVEKNFRGHNRDSLVKIIVALKELLGQTQSPGLVAEADMAYVLSAAPLTAVDEPKHAAIGRQKSEDPLELTLRELRAILKDPDFLASKSDLVEFIRKHFGSRISIRPEHRESRDALVDKAVVAFRKASAKDQRLIYQTVRKSYLRSRRSSLTDWSDIISGSGGEQ